MTSPWASPLRDADDPRDSTKSTKRWSIITIVLLALSGLLALTSATTSYEQHQRHVAMALEMTLGYEAFLALTLVVLLMPVTAIAWVLWIQALAGKVSALLLFGFVRRTPGPEQLINYVLLGVWYLGAVGVIAVLAYSYLSGNKIEYLELGIISGLIWTSALAAIGLVIRLSKETMLRAASR